MKTRKTLILIASLLMISLVSLAQSNPQKPCCPGRIVIDTNFLKKAMHIQIWLDTTSTMQFIIWHDTVYLLMLHAEMGMQRISDGSKCFTFKAQLSDNLFDQPPLSCGSTSFYQRRICKYYLL
jgi:hypothetical protein